MQKEHNFLKKGEIFAIWGCKYTNTSGLKNARHIAIVLTVSILALSSFHPNRTPRQRYRPTVISFFRDGGHGLVILLPVSGLVMVMSLILEGRNLFPDQIWTRYLDTRLRYYYTFALENKRSPYLNFTTGFNFDLIISAVCDFAPAYQISFKLDQLDGVTTSY